MLESMIILQTPRRLVLCPPQPLWVGGLAYSGFSRKWVGLMGGDQDQLLPFFPAVERLPLHFPGDSRLLSRSTQMTCSVTSGSPEPNSAENPTWAPRR